MAKAPAILLVGGNPTEEHPLLAWTLRTNVRLNRARLYVANIEANQAGAAGEGDAWAAAEWVYNDRCVALLAMMRLSDTDLRKALLARGIAAL